jgi:RNA polymerase sigma factor (sigma-70 family)
VLSRWLATAARIQVFRSPSIIGKTLAGTKRRIARALDVSNLYARTWDAIKGPGSRPGVAGIAAVPPPPERPEPAAASDVAGLFRERHAELVRLAVLVVGDRPTAEDVVQDVFARLCARNLLPDGDALAYVRAAVLNGCRSVLRRRTLTRRLRGAADLDRSDAAPGSAENEVMLAEDRRQVLAALSGLPVRRREVLVLRYWLGLSEAEIAGVLGISPGTVKSNAARGLAALARKLGESS